MAAGGLIELEGVGVRRGAALAVRDVSLTVAAGRWFGVLGANGSGKTSLLRALAGRLPFVGGACRIDGVDLASDRHARARVVGFAPPADHLPDALTGRELLDLVAGNAAVADAALAPLAEPLSLPGVIERRIGACSAGMRQRLALACAFVGSPRAVVLDEPFNWLDPVAAFDLRGVLRGLVDDGLTLVTALHDLTSFALACDEGALLEGGRVALALEAAALEDARRDPAAFERRSIARLRAGGPT